MSWFLPQQCHLAQLCPTCALTYDRIVSFTCLGPFIHNVSSLGEGVLKSEKRWRPFSFHAIDSYKLEGLWNRQKYADVICWHNHMVTVSRFFDSQEYNIGLQAKYLCLRFCFNLHSPMRKTRVRLFNLLCDIFRISFNMDVANNN